MAYTGIDAPLDDAVTYSLRVVTGAPPAWKEPGLVIVRVTYALVLLEVIGLPAWSSIVTVTGSSVFPFALTTGKVGVKASVDAVGFVYDSVSVP
jgi:hypothetical protein